MIKQGLNRNEDIIDRYKQARMGDKQAKHIRENQDITENKAGHDTDNFKINRKTKITKPNPDILWIDGSLIEMEIMISELSDESKKMCFMSVC